VFLEAITSGPLDPMYTTLLIAFLETKDSALSDEHNILSVEFISLSAQGLLTATSFADTILSKPNIYLTGLHLLFDENIRLMRELRREGLDLLETFKSNFIRYEMDSDLSGDSTKSTDSEESKYLARNVKRLTIIGRHNDSDFAAFQNSLMRKLPTLGEEGSSCLDEESSYMDSLVEDNDSAHSSSKQYDVLLSYAIYCFDDESLDAKDDTGLPHYLKCFDIYCAFIAMKCILQLNDITKTICPAVELDRVASAIRHRELHLAKTLFFAWFDYIEAKKQRAEGNVSDDSEDDEDPDAGGGAAAGKKILSPLRRAGRAVQLFTLKEEGS
jgi:hypothetical protein